MIPVISSTRQIFPKQKDDQVTFLSQMSPCLENTGQTTKHAFLQSKEPGLSLSFSDHLWSLVSFLTLATSNQTYHILSILYNCCCCCLVAKSCLTLLQPPWLVPHQAPLSMGFPGQEYWSGLPFLCPRNHPDPRIKPASPALAGEFFIAEPRGKPWWLRR